MRVVEVRPRSADGELVGMPASWLDRSLRDVCGAVHRVGHDEAVPVHAGRLSKVVGHMDPHPVPLHNSDARARDLHVERVRGNPPVRQDAPLHHGRGQGEDLDPVFDSRNERRVARGRRRRDVADVVGIDRRHVSHRLSGGVAGHDHSGRHNGAADVLRAQSEVDADRGDRDPDREREHRQQCHRGELRAGRPIPSNASPEVRALSGQPMWLRGRSWLGCGCGRSCPCPLVREVGPRWRCVVQRRDV